MQACRLNTSAVQQILLLAHLVVLCRGSASAAFAAVDGAEGIIGCGRLWRRKRAGSSARQRRACRGGCSCRSSLEPASSEPRAPLRLRLGAGTCGERRRRARQVGLRVGLLLLEDVFLRVGPGGSGG